MGKDFHEPSAAHVVSRMHERAWASWHAPAARSSAVCHKSLASYLNPRYSTGSRDESYRERLTKVPWESIASGRSPAKVQ